MAIGTEECCAEKSRRSAMPASCASSQDASAITCRATTSPASAAAKTAGNRIAKSRLALAARANCGSDSRLQAVFSSEKSPPARHDGSRSARSSPTSSAARSTARTAARPIQCADPSSETANPQPPARAIFPCASRPKTIEPVPAITITPGPLPKAASSAISMSPTTLISPGIISATILHTLLAISGRPAPAAPMHARSTC